MYISSRLIDPMDQTACAPAMIGVVLDDLAVGENLQHVIDSDRFCGHFLLCVLGNADLLSRRSLAN
jgi:hypothetical protein